MKNVSEWLRLPDDEALEAGEDISEEEPEGSDRSSWVPPRLEPTVQARSNGCHARPCETGGPITAYPAEARGQSLWEVFEGPDERLMGRDPASGLGGVMSAGAVRTNALTPVESAR